MANTNTKAEDTNEEQEEHSPRFRTELPSIMQEGEGDLDHCPSFNSYSVDRLADTAARVTSEVEGFNGDGDYDDDFEFVSFQKSGEHVVFDGPITPTFPIFNHHLLLEKSDEAEVNDAKHENAPTIRISLEKLLIDDRDRDPPSSSSSEADELDGVPPGTYCVWCPKPVQAAERGRCEKSKSTGSGSSSSRRWRIRDLLRRSNSDGGKNSLVILTPFSRSESTKKKEQKSDKLGEVTKGQKSSSETNTITGKSTAKRASGEKLSSAHEVFYVKNRMLKEGDRRRSYLPYRRDLVGFWANISGSSRAFPPF